MIEVFSKKIKKKEYISNDLYQSILEEDKSIIPKGFNIEEYNNKILDKMYQENKKYFDHLYDGIDSKIHLDQEQCKAILSDEKYSLIIAGAGTGKTTTMASKVKYLVDKKKVQPERILVISYTRKAIEELAERIEVDFDLPVNIMTFHRLGYRYIREIFKNKKCVVIDRNKMKEISLKYMSRLYKQKDKIEKLIQCFQEYKDFNKIKKDFIFSRFFIDNYKNYETYEELIDQYVSVKIEEAKKSGIEEKIKSWVDRQLLKDDDIHSTRGEIVKSAGEAIIANFLFKHGIDYSYEEPYDELLDNYSIYKPDFTVDYGGEKIYIEYFGMDDENYNKIKKKKEEFHKKKKNKFIEIERTSIYNIPKVLHEKLRELKVYYKNRSDEEIYETILRQNPLSQVYPLMDALIRCTKTRKESSKRNDNQVIFDYIEKLPYYEREKYMLQATTFIDFYDFYFRECYGGDVYYFDYSDLLYYSVKYLEKIVTSQNLLFDYILIDEYQDISKIKYELVYKTAKRNDAKVYAVGDDWQTIYSFSGSRIEYIYNFEKFFPKSKIQGIYKTYRNSQELIDIAGEFIMKNDYQIKKKLISEKHIKHPIEFREFEDADDEIRCLKDTILEIHQEHPEHKILILSRTNRMIEKIFEDDELIDSIGTNVVFNGNEDIRIDLMTMHKSKGLTFDEVIIVGLDEKYPSSKGVMWLDEIYRNKVIREPIEHPEERRVFYVALTRTKNKVYLLKNKDSSKRSKFITEIESMIQ